MRSHLAFILLILLSCQPPDGQPPEGLPEATRIFEQLTPEQSGIGFTNTLTEDSVVNYFTYPYIYMGGGIAVGDVNNDGLQDIYFTGNQVENRLYLNQGDLVFEDITEHAGVVGDDRWVTGVTMADVNHDAGWISMLACRASGLLPGIYFISTRV